MPVSVVVFDLGNVTVHFNPQRAADRLLPHCRVRDEVLDLLFRSEATRRLEIGEIQPLEYFRIIKQRLGFHLSPEDFTELWSDVFELNEDALHLVRSLTGVRKYLLSNTNPVHVRWIGERFPGVFDPYDRLFLSYEVGLRKPDPAIFRLVMEASGRPPEQHVFADDTEAHVRAAREVGMQAIVFRSAEQLAADLEALGMRAAYS